MYNIIYVYPRLVPVRNPKKVRDEIGVRATGLLRSIDENCKYNLITTVYIILHKKQIQNNIRIFVSIILKSHADIYMYRY